MGTFNQHYNQMFKWRAHPLSVGPRIFRFTRRHGHKIFNLELLANTHGRDAEGHIGL
jgi:hypothetical protein